jgi:hypothetical protein
VYLSIFLNIQVVIWLILKEDMKKYLSNVVVGKILVKYITDFIK